MCKEVVGEILYFQPNHINWKIPHFSDLLPKRLSRISSPKFMFFNESKKFVSPPTNWPKHGAKANFTKLSITIRDGDSNPFHCVRIGLTEETEKEIDAFNCVWHHTFKAFQGFSWIEEKELTYRREGVIPNGFLRFTCEIPSEHFNQVFPQTTQSGDQNNTTPVVTTNSSIASFLSSSGSWNCNMCCIINNASESMCNSCGNPRSKRMKNQSLNNLSQTFKDMLKEKKDTDLTIKVQGQEFEVHRLFLRARSSKFDAMLLKKEDGSKAVSKSKKTTRKQQNDVIELEDFEPNVFEEFLLFIYSGKTENINCDNVFGLYNAANNHNLSDLKSECVNFLKKSVSLNNICDVVSLATKSKDRELLNIAIDFFAKNMNEILNTNNWMVFLKDDPITANELCIKALKLGFTKREEFSL